MEMASAVSVVNGGEKNGHRKPFEAPIFCDGCESLSLKHKVARHFMEESIKLRSRNPRAEPFFMIFSAKAAKILAAEGAPFDLSGFEGLKKDSDAAKLLRRQAAGFAIDLASSGKWDVIYRLFDCGGLAASPPSHYVKDCGARKFWFDLLCAETGSERPTVGDYNANCLRWLIKHYGNDPAGPIAEFYPSKKELLRYGKQIYSKEHEILRMGDEINLRLMKAPKECSSAELAVLVKFNSGTAMQVKRLGAIGEEFANMSFMTEEFSSKPTVADFNRALSEYNSRSGKKVVFRFNARRLGFLMGDGAPVSQGMEPGAVSFKNQAGEAVSVRLSESEAAELRARGEISSGGYVFRANAAGCVSAFPPKEGKSTKGSKCAEGDYSIICSGGRLRAMLDQLAPIIRGEVPEKQVKSTTGAPYLARQETHGGISIWRDEEAVLRGIFKPLCRWSSDDIGKEYHRLLDHHTLYWLVTRGFSPEGQELFKSAPYLESFYRALLEYNERNRAHIRVSAGSGCESRLMKNDSVEFFDGGLYRIRNKNGRWLFFKSFEPWEMNQTEGNLFKDALLHSTDDQKGKEAIAAFLNSAGEGAFERVKSLSNGQSAYFRGNSEGDFRIVREGAVLELWSSKLSVIARATRQIEGASNISEPGRATMKAFLGQDGLLMRTNYKAFLLLKTAHPQLQISDMKYPPGSTAAELRNTATSLFNDWDGWFAWQYPGVFIEGDPIVSWKKA